MSEEPSHKLKFEPTPIAVAIIGAVGVIAVALCGVIGNMIPPINTAPAPILEIVIAATINAQATYDAVYTAQVQTSTAISMTATYTPTASPIPTLTSELPTSTNTSTPTPTNTSVSPTYDFAPTLSPTLTLTPIASPSPTTPPTLVSNPTIQQVIAVTPSPQTIGLTSSACLATVRAPNDSITLLRVVYSRPNTSNRLQPIGGVSPQETVNVLEQINDNGQVWYRVRLSSNQEGWIEDRHLELNDGCTF